MNSFSPLITLKVHCGEAVSLSAVRSNERDGGQVNYGYLLKPDLAVAYTKSNQSPHKLLRQ